MKLSKSARSRKNLMTSADKKKIEAAARTHFDFQIINANSADLIALNYK